MPVLNKAFQIVSRPVIILTILIRLVGTPIYRNKKEIINRIIIALKAPANYVQIIAKNSSDLDKSQWVTVQKKERATEKKEVKKIEISNRFIFIRQGDTDRMPEEDLILKLNTEIRRLENMPKSVKTIKMLYLGKKAISVFLSDKSDVNELGNKYRNRLIKVVKTVDVLIISAKIITKQHKIKLAGILLYRYL